eukprot:6502774-Lingulodinium_polyedra.AAC.1
MSRRCSTRCPGRLGRGRSRETSRLARGGGPKRQGEGTRQGGMQLAFLPSTGQQVPEPSAKCDRPGAPEG